MGRLTDASRGGSTTGRMKSGESRTVTVGERALVIIRSLRPYEDDLANALNATKSRDDIEWKSDGSGGIRLQTVDTDTPFIRFMRSAKRRELTNDDLRDLPFRWLNIAAEYGYLRHLGDHRYEVRKYTGYEAEPPRN